MANTEVYILGQKYTIKGDASEEYILELARYLNGKLDEVFSVAPNTAPLKAMILASLSIADELHRLKAEQEAIAKKVEEKASVLTGLFDTE